MNSYIRKQSVLYIVVMLVSIAAAYAGGEEETTSSVPEGAIAGDLILKEGIYDYGGEYPADLGTLVVPENRSDTSSRLIAVPVVRIPAVIDQPKEPIFVLQGGPGISNINFGQVSFYHENHDVVIVGYRGVDGSVVLDCPEIDNHYVNYKGDVVSSEGIEASTEAHAACAKRLTEEGIDLEGYTFAEVVEDVETVRKAFRYERINLISESIGTRIAMYYSWKHPDMVHRSAMVGVNPPGRTVYDPEMIDKQIDFYTRLCAEDPNCSARTDNLGESIRVALQNIPEYWLGIPLYPGNLKWFTFELLQNTSAAAQIFDVWLAAAEGDYSGMALMSLIGAGAMAGSVVWGENTAKFTSMGDYDYNLNYAELMNPPGSYIGSPRSMVADATAVWPRKPIAEEYRSPQSSDIETLIVNGTIDFHTPAQYATEELMPLLSKGQEVILADFGHVGDLYFIQPEAMERLLSSFFATGVADDSLFEHNTVNFDPGLGFPAIAKIGLGAIVTVLLGATALTLVLLLS